jgi:magnesium transporter
MTEPSKNNPVKEIIQIDNELISNITHLIENQAETSIKNLLTDLHSADIAEIINHLKTDDASYIFNTLSTETAGEVITELDDNIRERILKGIDEVKITNIVDELDTDDATDIVSDLPDDVAERVLEKIDREDSDDVKELLKYPEDSAGGIMSSDFVYVIIDDTVKDAIEQVRINSDEFDHIYYIYVLKPDDELVGKVSLKSLLVNPLNSIITEVMEEDLIYVTPEVDQEEVAKLMEKYDLVSIPVVDESKKMLGRITIDDVVDVIQDEASEDLQKVAGLSEEQESSDSIFRISRIRLPWLIIALVMEVVAAKLLQSFEESIVNLVFATFFIPIVMAMGGSSGTQAAIVMVKGISTGDVWIKDSIKKLSKEFFVSMLNGLSCGLLLLVATRLFFNDVAFNFAILLSVSLLVIIIVSTMVGATTPLVFKKFGTDPAIATGPFVTTSNDILGLLIYLSFVTIFYVA